MAAATTPTIAVAGRPPTATAVKRRYASTHRQEQAEQTRQAILAAAATLFVDPGFAASTGQLRPDYSTATVVDVLWLAMDVRNYDWLVRERGWPPDRYQRWYVDSVAAAILSTGPAGTITRGSRSPAWPGPGREAIGGQVVDFPVADAFSPFAYTNLPDRAAATWLTLASRAVPQIGRVQAQVAPYAQAWREANLRALTGEGPLWVVLGDSLSQGIGASAYHQGWVGQAQAALAVAGRPYRVVNLSISGARTDEVLARQVPALEGLDQVAALVTLLVGSNDLFSRRRESLAATFTALLERVPLSTIVATLPNPTRAASAANDVVERVAARRGLILAETRTPQMQSWRGKLSGDHFHPNDRGYTAIADVFVAAIQQAAGH